jgi:homoserine O-acetyltransferase
MGALVFAGGVPIWTLSAIPLIPLALMPDASRPTPDSLQKLVLPEPLRLDCGRVLDHVEVAYETWGELNAARTNAVLVCHALTGDQFCASDNPVTGRPAWWPRMVGPGLPVDTDRYFVIATNVLGGCMGTTGPASLHGDGEPWGTRFPVITIADMVRAQRALVAALGIDSLFCVIGGSMGGMQVLQWAASYPERVFSAVPIATAARHSAQNIAFHEVGRQAIMADPNWHGGGYFTAGAVPEKGLAVARMAAHITYLSEPALHSKFGRNLQDRDRLGFGFDADFQVESYLRHQGSTFVDRFDANSYLYLTRAMDYFDLAAEYDGVLAEAFRDIRTRFCVVSFTSDWLFPTVESRQIVQALNAAAANVSFVEIESDKGHDAFLLDEPEFFQTLTGFLNAAAEKRGLTSDAAREDGMKLFPILYKAFVEKDMSLLEINPLIIMKDGHLRVLDAKVSFDGNSLFRHPDIMELRDKTEEDEKEIEASEWDLAYIALDGTIGCMVNGAGLAMATMDIIKLYGEEPANFCDVGGGANAEKVAAAFKIIMKDPNVKGILVNIFGGIMKCDVIAEGVLQAVKETNLQVPLVVRLEGTNVDAGKAIIANSGLNVIPADDLDDAAQKIVAAVKS